MPCQLRNKGRTRASAALTAIVRRENLTGTEYMVSLEIPGGCLDHPNGDGGGQRLSKF